MPSKHTVPHNDSFATPAWTTTYHVADWRTIPLQERFEIFDAFMHEVEEMKDHFKACTQIAPAPHVGAGRRCVKRVPVPLFPTIFEYPEDDYLEDSESTTACDDDGLPADASPCDKPLPLVPLASVSKALPPTPVNRDKPLPSPPPPSLPRTPRKDYRNTPVKDRRMPRSTPPSSRAHA